MATFTPELKAPEGLVAKQLPRETLDMGSPSPLYASSAARIWYAWQALERDEKGMPPSLRSLEEGHRISHGTLNKLIEARAKLERTNHERVLRIAAALNTTPDWLLYGTGKPPASHWPVPVWPGPKKKTRSGTMPAVKLTK